MSWCRHIGIPPYYIISRPWDCLWYVNEFILSLGYTLEEVAQMGLSKLAKRKAEGKIHGEGSNR